MTTTQAKVSNWRNELVPNIVDHLAKVTPDAPYALYPISPVTYDDGYRTVTYKDFANAINGIAWWLEKRLGRSADFEVLAYIGPNDIRYTALLLGAIKAGYVAFFTSPRNSIAAHHALFRSLKCRALLSPSPDPPMIDSIIQSHPMEHLHVPSVEDLLSNVYPHYPYDKEFNTARSDPFVIIHTSGSTGIPKPLLWSHETVQRHSNYLAKDPPVGSQSLDRLSQGKRILNTFPPFHGACIAIHIMNGVPFGTVSVAPLSGMIPSAEGVVNALKATSADVAFLVPSIAADLARNSEHLDYLSKHIELILYCGGDLPQAVGDNIAAKVPIQCQYGASEIGLTSQLLPEERKTTDWRYVRYHPDLGIKFEETVPGMFEMIVKRDPELEESQVPFSICPTLNELQVYRSRDLFQKHPTIQDYWVWRARADDIIVFLNGEKTNPISMEQHIVASNQDVSAALVFGSQQVQAGLLIEPAPSLGEMNSEEAKTFIEKIWPSIEEANKDTPEHARIDKGMVLLTARERPMIRSGKGTIQRQGTIANYSNEIDKIYLGIDASLNGNEKFSGDQNDLSQVARFIRQTIERINPDLLQEECDNFFALGMDSLSAIRLTKALTYGLTRIQLNVSTIYNNPSVDQLTHYIVGKSTVNGAQAAHDQSEMATLLEEYEEAFKQVPTAKSRTGEVAILTGSTGSLGTHLLESLLARQDVVHVYCLNRRKNAREIHEAKAEASGFSFKHYQHRVSFVHSVLDQPNLGIDLETYEALRIKTTLIIHNAWPVNFMLPFKAFRPHFDGLMNLFSFASTCIIPPKLLYISSLSSVAQYPRITNSSLIPEEVIRDFGTSYPIGYAKSKLFSELLCDAAAQKLNIHTSFARVGQIAGPVNGTNPGIWNVAEWLPSLIITSISLCALPIDLGAALNKVDWMPADILATGLVELAMNREDESCGRAEVLNVFSPRETHWKDLVPSIVESVEKHAKKRLDVVSPALWLGQLRNVANGSLADNADLARTHPAIKLQEFYEGRLLGGAEALSWQKDYTLSKSQTLEQMPVVHAAWVDQWVRGWVLNLQSARPTNGERAAS